MYLDIRQLPPGTMTQFEKTFGVNIFHYWDFGLDIVKLDEEVIKPSDSETTEQAIIRQYGQPAADLVRLMMGA